MARRKRLCNEGMSGEEEVKRMETKYASLKEDYVELQRHTRALRKRAGRNNDKMKRLRAEVRFLRGKYQMFKEKNCEEPVNPSVFSESGAKVPSVYRKPREPTKLSAIEDEPIRCELAGLQPLMSTDHHTSPEMTGLQFSPMRITPAFIVHHSSSVTPALTQSNKKRDLDNNGLVSAQKPYKVKDGKKKKIKTDLSIFPEYSAKSITISKKPKEPAEAMAIEDKSRRHELTGMQTFSSTYDRTLPEMPSVFKVPHSSLVTSAVIDSRNEKIKADALASTEFRAQIISNSKRPKEPIKGLVIADKPAKHELTGMQLLSSTDDFTAPEMTRLQPSAIMTMPGSKVPHSSLVTPTVEPANKKRRLENNGKVVASARKPYKVKDDRNRKIKADPWVSPEFVARNISVSNKTKEPTKALAIENEHARYELTGMQPLLSTNDCTLPEMTELQPSATRITTAFTVPHRSFAAPIVEPAKKKRHLKIIGPVRVEKPSHVKDGQNMKIRAPLVSLECGVENLPFPKDAKNQLKCCLMR